MPELKGEYTKEVAKELKEKFGIDAKERLTKILQDEGDIEAKRCGIDPKTVKITVTETDK